MKWLDLREESQRARVEVPDLPELSEAAIATWRGRMVNEFQSSAVFAALAQQAGELGLSAAVVAELRDFEAEERRHGVLCGGVVESLGGVARMQTVAPRPFPTHLGVEPLEAFLRNVLSVSCLSETVAVALIGAERLEMPEGPLRQTLSTIWADEVGHARFGWRVLSELLPTLGADALTRLSLYLRVALRHLELHELAHLPLASNPPAPGAALGLCSGADARVLFYETVCEAILPPLEALGLHARAAWDERGRADGVLSGLV